MTKDNVGQTIAGRYRIIDIIGQGGLSTVYMAVDNRLDRIVAVKMLHPRFADDPEFKHHLWQEIDMMISLDCENIITVFDYGQVNNQLYYVMEYVDGSSLDRIMDQHGLFDAEYAIEIVRDVGKALSCTHRRGIVHRDVKPGNILISRDGKVLLSDLGLAMPSGRETLTKTGVVLGTPIYMSPEQVQGKPVDHRSDIYSLGVVLYELLVGRPPFSGSTSGVLRKIVSELPPSPSESSPRISRDLGDITLRALAKDPRERYQSIEDFIVAIDNAKTQTSPSETLFYQERSRHTSSSLDFIGPMLVFIGTILLLLFFVLWFFRLHVWNWIRNHTLLVLTLGGTIALSIAIVTIRRTRQNRLRRITGIIKPITKPIAPRATPPIATTKVLRQDPGTMAWLLGLNGIHRGKQFRIADAVTLGRALDCEVVLKDPAASREHARILLENGCFYIYDLASINGTRVNGERITRCELQDRDEIQIGNTTMLFIQVASSEDLTAEAKRRLREFDSVWDELRETVYNDD